MLFSDERSNHCELSDSLSGAWNWHLCLHLLFFSLISTCIAIFSIIGTPGDVWQVRMSAHCAWTIPGYGSERTCRDGRGVRETEAGIHPEQRRTG